MSLPDHLKTVRMQHLHVSVPDAFLSWKGLSLCPPPRPRVLGVLEYCGCLLPILLPTCPLYSFLLLIRVTSTLLLSTTFPVSSSAPSLPPNLNHLGAKTGLRMYPSPLVWGLYLYMGIREGLLWNATPAPQFPSDKGFPHVVKCVLGCGYEHHEGLWFGVRCTRLLFNLKENTFPFMPEHGRLFLLIIQDHHSSPFLTLITVMKKNNSMMAIGTLISPQEFKNLFIPVISFSIGKISVRR